MKLFNKLIILIFYICFSTVGAFSESFKLTCDFGSSWKNKFTQKVQTHIVINDTVYFDEKDKQSKLNTKSGNKLIWSYKYDYQNYINYVNSNNFFSGSRSRNEFFHFKPTQFSTYTYFKSNNKINIETKTNWNEPYSAKTRFNLGDSGWGTCKREPLDQAT